MAAALNQFQNVVTLLSIAAIIAIGSLAVELANNTDYQFKGSKLALFQSGQVNQAAPQFAELDPVVRHEAMTRFNQGASLLHAKRYEFAVTAFSRVIELVPNMPEAYVNMGYALLGQKRFAEAGEFFNQATILRPQQTNAYWGLAEALEGLKDYEGALGAMRSYIHLSTPDDPFVAKARSALWELEAQLGRIPGVKVAEDQDQEEAKKNLEEKRPKWQEGH